MAKGKVREAEKLIKRIEKVNKLRLPSDLVVINSNDKSDRENSSCSTDSSCSPIGNHTQYSSTPVTLSDSNHLDEIDLQITGRSDVQREDMTGSSVVVVGGRVRQYSVLDLFRTPRILRYTLINFYLW